MAESSLPDTPGHPLDCPTVALRRATRVLPAPGRCTPRLVPSRTRLGLASDWKGPHCTALTARALTARSL
ncbi:hypothetical protein [Caudoviricetes sp.]|nr:hypothetical protein [Caudoviricetes sp.]